MFSQLRSAVEQLAQQPIRVLDGEHHSELPPRQSLDMQARSASPLSSGQLAESALSSLRKSFVSQRPGSSVESPRASSTPSPPQGAPRKSNLEERLRRATLAVGEASGSPSTSTPKHSSRIASPSPMSRNPLKRVEGSPCSTPLPASPVVLPATENGSQLEQPTDFSLKDTETTPVLDSPLKEDPLGIETSIETSPLSFQDPVAETNPSRDDDDDTTRIPQKSQVEESEPVQQVEIQDIKHDNLSSPIVQEPIDKEAVEAVPTEGITAQPEEFPDSPIPDTPPILESNPPVKEEEDPRPSPQPPATVSPTVDQRAEIEVLQARLKQVEQRFTGIRSPDTIDCFKLLNSLQMFRPLSSAFKLRNQLLTQFCVKCRPWKA